MDDKTIDQGGGESVPGAAVDPIFSDRLELVAMSPEFLRSSIAGDAPEAERLLGTSMPQERPGHDRDLFALRLAQFETDRSLTGRRQFSAYCNFHE